MPEVTSPVHWQSQGFMPGSVTGGSTTFHRTILPSTGAFDPMAYLEASWTWRPENLCFPFTWCLFPQPMGLGEPNMPQGPRIPSLGSAATCPQRWGMAPLARGQARLAPPRTPDAGRLAAAIWQAETPGKLQTPPLGESLVCPIPVRPNETLMALLMKMKTWDMPSTD